MHGNSSTRPRHRTPDHEPAAAQRHLAAAQRKIAAISQHGMPPMPTRPRELKRMLNAERRKLRRSMGRYIATIEDINLARAIGAIEPELCDELARSSQAWIDDMAARLGRIAVKVRALKTLKLARRCLPRPISRVPRIRARRARVVRARVVRARVVRAAAAKAASTGDPDPEPDSRRATLLWCAPGDSLAVSLLLGQIGGVL